MIIHLQVTKRKRINLEQKELINKCDIFNLVKTSDVNTKVVILPTKSELREEKDKIARLQTFDLSYFHGKNFFGDNAWQNIFVYQPTLDMLELRKDKDTDNFLGWKSKGYIFLNLSHYILLSCLT